MVVLSAGCFHFFLLVIGGDAGDYEAQVQREQVGMVLLKCRRKMRPMDSNGLTNPRSIRMGVYKSIKLVFVVKGYAQVPSSDFFETFLLILELTILSLSQLWHRPPKNKFFFCPVGFLNRELQDKVSVEQPQGFIIKGLENRVYKLEKELYGLKQAPTT